MLKLSKLTKFTGSFLNYLCKAIDLRESQNKMIIDPFKIHPRDAYQLLIGSVVPRPIAWVSTIAEDGTLNLAPYSFFMGVTGDPPTVAISCNKRKGEKKDTLANVEANGELVLNLAVDELAEQMNASSAELEPDVDEFELAGLTPAPSELVRPPRVAESPINIECKLQQIVYTGRNNSTGLIIAEAKLWHIRDDLINERGTINVHNLHAIGRLSYNWYTRTHDLFEMIRPGYQEQNRG